VLVAVVVEGIAGRVELVALAVLAVAVQVRAVRTGRLVRRTRVAVVVAQVLFKPAVLAALESSS